MNPMNALAPLPVPSSADPSSIPSLPHNLEAEQALLGSLMFDNAVFERLSDRVRTMAVEQAMSGQGDDLDRWADVWEVLERLPREAEALNLDRADSFWTAVRALRAAAA